MFLSCSTPMSLKYVLHIKTKNAGKKTFVCVLTFISMRNFIFSQVENEKYTEGKKFSNIL